ncbi:hypothetical protein Lal_00035446 [Lupinus albus]|nr:hypothetical protein Lal_00035446 [Lupinus albus]
MTRRNTCILHSINPEIDRTFHRLVRQNRTLDTNFVSVSEHPVAENTASEHSVSVHSKYSDSMHSVAFPNFDHSVHSENMAQPPSPPGPRLNNMDRSIIDAASGGALGDMTSFEARCLIEKMASNSQQFNARSGDAIVVRGFHDVGTNAARQDKLETKIDSLTTLITQLAINQQKSSMARVCGICTSCDHYSDMCPLLEPRTGDHPESETCNVCIDEFLNIDIDVPYISLYIFHACTDFELCDSCIDEFLNIVVDSPVTHSHCTNTIDAGIRQQSGLFVKVQVATKPSFATFFPSILQAPDWTPPFDLECDILVYALGTVLASYEFDLLPP